MADLIEMLSRWANSGLSAMLSRLCSSSLDGFSSSSTEPTRRSAMDDFQSIMRMLSRIGAVLGDAEEREIQDRSVDLWLSELRLLVYDIDDVVDEYEYDVLQAHMQAKHAEEAYHHGKHKRGDEDHHDENERDGGGRNMLESSSSQVPPIPDGMAKKLREIRERFDEIERHRKALQLREEDGVRRSIATWKTRPTSSLIDETSIIGREDDKEKIMELLLSDSEHSNNFKVRNKITVLPIVGMGGVGKTTLAQCIYNDPRICQYFDQQRWIYVSEDFDLVRLTKEIYRSITNKPWEEGVGLDHLQGSIKKELMRFKRTFLVLDDVWNEERCLWESLQLPFHGPGIVTILVTTRNEKVANVMRTTNSFHLGFLSEEEGCQLFQQYALCDDENLLRIGQGIVRKCGGLPLAIKLLGSHLQFERDEDKWMSIFESELWESDPGVSEILPALRLSYQRMPSHLKPCFRYCSMFPKNEILDKNRVVWLWVAQGYIQARTINKTIEEAARDYFDELLGRSFLQVVENNHNSFKMHDLIFDLAVSISSKEFIKITLEDVKQNKFIPYNIRHLVIYDQRTHNGAEANTLSYPVLSRHIALRSIFYNGASISDIFHLLDPLCLRTLHINFSNLDLNNSMFWDLVPLLKHLRYLYVSMPFAIIMLSKAFRFEREMKKLRELGLLSCFNSLHGMYNLQVLDFYKCEIPLVLQASINNLINLRHLILPFGSFMPCGISKLTSLQTLNHVIVNDGSHECGELSEIEDLESLTGSCRIHHIKSATDVVGVKKANISKKKHIWRLCLDWNYGFHDLSFDVDIGFGDRHSQKKQRSVLAEAMLEALRPHNDLKELEIKNYPGIRFPLWFGDPSYSKLRDIKFQDCYELSTLRGLCNLHVLESLQLIRCHNLLIPAEDRLPSKLRFVCFSHCWKLTSLTGLQDLHFLEKLVLILCPKLELSLDENFSIMPGLVNVIDCPGLREWCHKYGFEFNQDLSQIKELSIDNLKVIESRYGSANLISLKTLYICNSYERHFPEYECIPCSLNTLHLLSCERLKIFPQYQNLSTLRLLKIWRCTALTYLLGVQMMTSLEKLEIMECPQFTLSPVQILPSKLQYLHINNCPRLMWLPGLQQLFSLRDLRLCECRELMLLPPEQLPFMHQVQLEIINCPKLAKWCLRHNLSYNKKDSPKELIASSNQQINSWLEEKESVLFENICVLDYDEGEIETKRWPAFRLLSLYVCSCVHLKTIKLCDNIIRLKQLRIWNCSHLERFSGLWCLTSLQEMDISSCPELSHKYFPQLARRIEFPAFRYLKISRCPKLSIEGKLTDQYPPPDVEIRACPQLQEWCLENHIEYFQD